MTCFPGDYAEIGLFLYSTVMKSYFSNLVQLACFKCNSLSRDTSVSVCLQDQYLHTNCLAALANMSSQFSSLHPYVSQRLVKYVVSPHIVTSVIAMMK